jgi:chromosome segregation ATPase
LRIIGIILAAVTHANRNYFPVGCTTMVTEDGSMPIAPDKALSPSPAEGRALAPAKRPFWAITRLFRRNSRKLPDSPIIQLSVAGLQAELQELDREISATMANLADLEAAEREAVRTRDKLALDVAWQSREREAARLIELEQQRALVRDGLAQRFGPEIEAWRERSESTVARWRAEDREHLETIEQNLRQAESLIWALSQREKNRAAERESLTHELEVLIEKAPSIPLARPEIDWSTEPLSLRDITARLDSIHDLLQQLEEPRTPAGV